MMGGRGDIPATVGAGGVFSRNQWGLFDQTQTSAHRFPKRRRLLASSCICKDAAGSGWVEPLSRKALVGGTLTRGGDGKESPCRPRHHNPAQQGRKPPSASAPTVPLF